MQTPVLHSPDDRGKRWLLAQVLHILADNAVPLATPCAAGDPVCYWGTGADTETTLYLRLTGDPEPHALHFHRIMILNCGSGLYASQATAVRFIRRTLKKMGILST